MFIYLILGILAVNGNVYITEKELKVLKSICRDLSFRRMHTLPKEINFYINRIISLITRIVMLTEQIN